MTDTTQLSFSIDDLPMWGPNSPNIDQTYTLVNLNFADQRVFSLGGNALGVSVGLDIGFSYAAMFNLAAHLKWDLGTMGVAYEIDADILDSPEFSLNDIVHFDTSAFKQLSGQLVTSGLDPANFHFDVTMSYGAFAQFDTTTGVSIGSFTANLPSAYQIFNLPNTTNTLFEANLSDVVNGSIPFNYPGSLISGLLRVPLDPLTTNDTEEELEGDLSDLLSEGSTIDIVQAALDIDGLIAAFFGFPSPLGVSVPLFTDPGGGVLGFNFDLIDTTASLNFRVDQKFEFTPDPISVTMTVAETGQVLNGELGDDFVFDTPVAGYGNHNVHASFNLTGELRNLTSLVINGQLTLDILKASVSNTILAPGLGFEFIWGPLISFSKDWDLAKITLFDETFDVDLGTIEVDYVIPWERFYVGTSGADSLTLTPHQVIYDGFAGNDTITGNALDNTINGGVDNDMIMGKSGADILDGGDGADSLSYAFDPARVVVNLSSVQRTIDSITVDAGTAIDGYGFIDTVSNFEEIYGSGHADILIAGDAGSSISGGEGADQLFGSDAVDTLLGGKGIDTLHGGGGKDIVQGGEGDDFLYGDGDDDILMGQWEDDYIDGGSGFDLTDYQVDYMNVVVNLSDSGKTAGGRTVASMHANHGDDDTDTLVNIEGAIGSDHDDYFFGGAGDNAFYGRDGKDIFFASGGTDTLVGELGDDTYYVDSLQTVIFENLRLTGGGYDTIYASIDYSLADADGKRADIEDLHLTGAARSATGNALNNQIFGTAGNDYLDGGAGSDTLSGAGGNDTYVFDSAGDRVVEEEDGGHDTILLATGGFSNIGAIPTFSINESWAVDVEDLFLTDNLKNVHLTGNALDNVLSGNQNAQLIEGLGGNDMLIGIGGGDTLRGGDGDDTGVFNLAGQNAYNSVFEGGADTDTLIMDWSLATVDIIYGGTNYRTTISAVNSGDYSGYAHMSFTDVERFHLTGGAGNDNLIGGALEDILVGGAGYDRLEGKAGKGTYNGGSEVDIVIASIATTVPKSFSLVLQNALASEIIVNSGTDIETKWQGVEVVQLATAAGNDTLDARLNTKTAVNIHGYAGNWFNAGSGDDTFKINFNSQGYEHGFTGGDGTDTLVMDWAGANNAIIYQGTNYRTTVNALVSGDYSGYMHMSFTDVERFQLTGGLSDDNLVGGALDDILIGNAGTDRLEGKAGKGQYQGGDGTDIVIASVASAVGKNFVLALQATQSAEITVNSGTDAETKWRGVEVVHLATADGNDTLDARLTTKTAVNIWGAAGNWFNAGSGDDTFKINFNSQGYEHGFTGGDGVDTLVMDWSGANNDIIYNGPNYRTTVNAAVSGDYGGYMHMAFTDVERFQLTGGAGNDNLVGGAIDDILIGGDGFDRLEGKTGKGTYNGGAATDIVIASGLSEAGKNFTLALQATQTGPVTANSGNALETIWQGIETVLLTSGGGDDTLDASLTNKTRLDIHGANGNRFDAGAGNDTFKVNFSAQAYDHAFIAGDGTDTLVMNWAGATNAIIYQGTNYRTTVNAAVNGDYSGYMHMSFSDVERFQLTGGLGDDNLVGGAIDDILIGGAGFDRLEGKTGKGTYDGGTGTDIAIATVASDATNSFTLALQSAMTTMATVNGGSGVETKWRGIEVVQLVTAGGDDTLDAQLTNKTSVGIHSYSGNLFDAGAGNDTFKINFNSQGYGHSFAAGDGIDTLVMDWAGANNGIIAGDGYYRTTVNAVDSGDYSGYMHVYYSNVERFQLTGGAGDDNLIGGAIDDILIGNAGTDRLEGKTGKGTYDGGTGTDVAIATVASDAANDFTLALQAALTATTTVNGTTAIETKWRGIEVAHLVTAGGDDTLDAQLAAKTRVDIYGYGGNVFDSGAGNDTFKINFNSQGSGHSFAAGDDVDTLVMDWADATNDVIAGDGYFRTTVNAAVSGDYSGYMHVYYSSVERFQLTGGLGNDNLIGAALDDILIGGDGSDRLDGKAGKGTYNGGAGTDIAIATVASDTGKNFSLGLQNTQNAAVTSNGGTDIQTIWQGLEVVQLTTGAGNDTLDARLDAKTFVGIWSYSGNSFDAGAGNDTFRVNFNSQGYGHGFAGGDGTDTMLVDWSAATNGIIAGDGYYRTTVNAVNSGDYSGYMHVFYSSVERFQLYGGAGDDNLIGGALDDTLSGGAGYDRLEGKAGKGSYNGGAGMDLVIAEIASTTAANFSLALQATQTANVVVDSGGATETSWRGIEVVQLKTGLGNDVLDARLGTKTSVGSWGYSGNGFDAGGGDDTFKINFNSQGYGHGFAGGDGTDTLVMDWSGANNDIIYGGTYYRTIVNAVDSGDYSGYMHMSFSDVERFELTGGSGNDTLRGGDLGDTLSGGAGDDSLTGGLGADLFIYSGGNDQIVDFDITKDTLKSALFSTFTSFTQLLSKVDQTNHTNTVINFAAGTSLTLLGLDWIDLKATAIAHAAPTITSNGGAALALSVVENTTAVSTIVATDPDGGVVKFSLTGADASKFQISATGVLTFKAGPDFETKADTGANNVYDVTVRVTDNFGLTDTQAVAVTVTNIEEGPSITSNGGGATAAVSVAENSTAVTTVIAVDPEGDARVYSISGGADASKFTINATTGALTFKAAPDFETKTDTGANNIYDVIVKAVSTGGIDTQALAVTVTNVNEAPVITSNGGGSTASISIAENKTGVTTVASSDVDAGATRTYSISGGADAALFAINTSTGALTFKAAPSFETKLDAGANNIYDLIVKVTDDGGLTDSQAIAVTLTNVNEAPTITSNGGGSTASISLAENKTAVTTVTATDQDAGATRTYTISGGADAALFTINATTGALAFKAAPDFETKLDTGGNNVYDLVVKVTDDTGLTDSQAIAVTLTNVNEAPRITSNGGGSTAAISIAENKTVLTTVVSSDVDAGATRTYAISGGADAALFSINAATGALTFKAAPDFETKKDAGANNIYDLVVKVTDDGGLTDTQAIAVTVTDVNEAPTITSNGGGATASVSINENTTAVTTVTSTDPDAGATRTYSLFGGADASLFTINATTGALAFKSAPDFETKKDSGADNIYDVIVKVTDNGGLTDTQAIAVTIKNVNEAPGAITLSKTTVAENTAIGKTVGTFSAIDPEGKALSYKLTDTAGGLFKLSGTTLQVAKAIDYETVKSDTITVEVKDADGFAATKTFTITVTDVVEASKGTGGGFQPPSEQDSFHFGDSPGKVGDAKMLPASLFIPEDDTIDVLGLAATQAALDTHHAMDALDGDWTTISWASPATGSNDFLI